MSGFVNSVRAGSISTRDLGGMFKLVSVGSAVVFLVVLLISCVFFVAPNSIFESTFGFVQYAESLRVSLEYKSCAGDTCSYTSRMPVLPLFMWAASFLVEPHRYVALLHVAIVFPLFIVIMRKLAQIYADRYGSGRAFHLTWGGAFVVLALAAPVAKHAVQVEYEEGILIWLALPLVLAAGLHLDGDDAPPLAASMILAILGATAYLTKSSMLPFYVLLVLILTISYARFRKRAVVALIAMMLIVPVGWGMFSLTHTGRFTFMSSYDGENLYKGWNAETVKLYPKINLDVEFLPSNFGKSFRLEDGNEVTIAPKPMRSDFPDEWAWNDYYKALAIKNIMDDRALYLNLLGRKFQNYFLSLSGAPYDHDFVPGTKSRRLSDLLGFGVSLGLLELGRAFWLLVGRVVQVVALGACLAAIASPRHRLAGFGLLVLNALYAVPYIMGFSYERHITPGILLAFATVMALIPMFATGASAHAGRECRQSAG